MRKLLIAIVGAVLGPLAHAAEPTPLTVETRIPLGDVSGRIDHLAIDFARQRLYVAELGNDSVGVVDLKERKVLRTITGLQEPQGIAYVSSTDTVYVANAGDGSLRFFNADNLSPTGRIVLGDDADNVRVDTVTGRVYVGYASALAILDPVTRSKIADVALKAHPESFQLERGGSRIFVNVPAAHEIAVIDREDGKQRQSWPQQSLRANFPLALDEPNQHVLAVFRHPATLAVFSAKDGAPIGSSGTCGDADDVFVDRKRGRVYVSCGEGFVDTFERRNGAYVRIGHLATVAGARTSLYAPDIDRLFLAVRSTRVPASIWVLRPLS